MELICDYEVDLTKPVYLIPTTSSGKSKSVELLSPSGLARIEEEGIG